MKTDDELEALEKRGAALEAKLREAEGRAEKAARERDEARGRLRETTTLLHARSGSASGHSGSWSTCHECSAARAALGEKP